jgi:hypothetical protein
MTTDSELAALLHAVEQRTNQEIQRNRALLASRGLRAPDWPGIADFFAAEIQEKVQVLADYILPLADFTRHLNQSVEHARALVRDHFERSGLKQSPGHKTIEASMVEQLTRAKEEGIAFYKSLRDDDEVEDGQSSKS